LLFLFPNGATLALDEFAALHRKDKVTPRGQTDRHAPPTGTLSVFARSACALRNSVPFAGLLSDCADAAVASSKIKLASKSFIRISFYANDFAYHGAARNINRRMPEI